ncbi:MAG: hypothetical protein ACREVI_07040 [Steroidobacteraceae bacterium]
MTSFAIAIEPAPEPRLALLALLVHLAAAAMPWLARCTPLVATALSMLAIAGLLASIARIPGAHCSLRQLAIDATGCRARLAGRRRPVPATFASGTRAYAGLVVIDLRVDGRRRGWLLTRRSVPPDQHRRLRARVRLTC